MPGAGSLDWWEGLGGEPPQELPAKGQIAGVVLVESLVETTLASVSQSRLGSPPPFGVDPFWELRRVGQENWARLLLARGARRTLRALGHKALHALQDQEV